jgi:GT2 family glycosyltransferase
LEALARQKCPVPWNVVISDNGSTDGTVALARSYESRLPELLVVDSSERAGPGYARNVGAIATQAPLLVFCDADDEVGPGWLAAMVSALTNQPFVAGRFEAHRLNDARALRSRTLQQSEGLQASPFGPNLPHAGAGNLGVRRDVFLGVDGFDASVGCLEDTDLCWRIQLLTGVPLIFYPDAMVHVRLRSSLRTMWAQGRSYGAASALLEHRYPRAGTIDSASAPTSRRRRHRIARLLALVGRQRSVGSLLWTFGWHLGHRQWRPATPIRPVSPVRSQAADAA